MGRGAGAEDLWTTGRAVDNLPEAHRRNGRLHRVDSDATTGTLPGVSPAAAGAAIRPGARARLTVALALTVVGSVAYLLSPRMGIDLSAQLHRGAFARAHPFTPVDFSWFGGTLPLGYSLWAPWLMALVGSLLTGALAFVACTLLTIRLVDRLHPAVPWAVMVAIVVLQAENLIQGRSSFGCGMALGLLALLACAADGRTTGRRAAAAGAAAFLAASASPMAGLFLAIAAAALVAAHRGRDAAALLAGTVLGGVVTSVVFSDTGTQPFSAADARTGGLLCAVVVIACLRTSRPLTAGAVLAFLGVIVAYSIDSPVGSNITRLPLFFALPIVLAVSRRSVLAVLTVCAALSLTGQQLTHDRSTFDGLGQAPSTRAYFSPLIDAVTARGTLTGRIEIPEMVGHWDSAYVSDALPLARGWLQQTDVTVNHDVFYAGPIDPARYRTWLTTNAVQYIAVPDAPLLKHGRLEASFLALHPAGLTQVWQNAHWRLYAVSGATSLVDLPATVVAQHPAAITVTAPAGATVTVRLRWFDWLSVSGNGACLAPHDGQVQLRTTVAGTYTISSTLHGNRRHC